MGGGRASADSARVQRLWGGARNCGSTALKAATDGMEKWPNRSWRRFWCRGKRLMQAVSVSVSTGLYGGHHWRCLLWVWVTWWTCLPMAAVAADRPRNIVVIIADDLGWNDVGYHGSEIHTPHLDKLAMAGVRLERHYVYPTCSPTRAGLLTGRNPSRFGIHGPIAGRSEQSLPSGKPDAGRYSQNPRVHHRPFWEVAFWTSTRRSGGQYGFDQTYGYLHGQSSANPAAEARRWPRSCSVSKPRRPAR